MFTGHEVDTDAPWVGAACVVAVRGTLVIVEVGRAVCRVGGAVCIYNGAECTRHGCAVLDVDDGRPGTGRLRCKWEAPVWWWDAAARRRPFTLVASPDE